MPPPTSVLDVKLNKSMNFEFLDRSDMRIKFLHEGISHELDAGVRPKREGTYLDNRFGILQAVYMRGELVAELIVVRSAPR